MNWNEDEWQNGTAEHPRYIVIGEKVGTPFYRLEFALVWKEMFFGTYKLTLNIIDLTEYDWEANLANLKFHRINKNIIN